VYEYTSLKHVKKWLNPLLRPYMRDVYMQMRTQHEQKSKPSKVHESASKVDNLASKNDDLKALSQLETPNRSWISRLISKLTSSE
jgi:hypothetical protein